MCRIRQEQREISKSADIQSNLLAIGLHRSVEVLTHRLVVELAKNLFRFSFFRLLLQKEADPERWEKEISKMEYHPGQRAGSDIWKADSVNVVGYLRGPCKLKERFSEELIQQACGILEINAFEGKSAGGHKLRCIYPQMALLAHSCVPNTTHTILPRNDFK